MTPRRAAPEVALRPAAAADADVIAALFLATRRQAMPYLPELHTETETHAWIAGHVLPQTAVTVGEVDGRIVGFSSVHDGVLEHLYVLPARHGFGIGGTLLDAAKAAHPGGLRLFVFQQNALARRFYENRGFRLVELTDGAGNEERLPDALYAWPARGATAAECPARE